MQPGKPRLDALGVGSPIVDFIAEVQEDLLARIGARKGDMELVDTGRLQSLLAMLDRAPVRAPGGSAANTVFALANLGAACAFLGKLGNDDHSEYYRTTFERYGGDCSYFRYDPDSATACCLSLVTPDSERTMWTDLGAARNFAPSDLHPEDFMGCRHVHIEGYLLFDRVLLEAVLQAARQAGCRVSLDLGSFGIVETARDVLPDLLSDYVDIVFANEEEAAAFCGTGEPLQGLEALGQHCELVAVKLGPEGAWLQGSGERLRIGALAVEQVKDTTGAGDLWASGFLYGQVKGYSLATCGRLGALLGAAVVQHHGAGLPAETWERLRQTIRNIETEEGYAHASLSGIC